MSAAIFTVYIIFLICYIVASILALYQLWQFGYVGDASRKIIIAYIAISLTVMIGGIVLALAIR